MTQPTPHDIIAKVLSAYVPPSLVNSATCAVVDALPSLSAAGWALVDRKTLDQLRECYGDEFTDSLLAAADTAERKQMSAHGLCERDELHDAHEFPWGSSTWYCPGQYSQCRNCDDRKCMGCVFREYDHDCKHDCPFCCADTAEKEQP